MTSLPGTDLGPLTPLAEYLQEITEALAATSTQRGVIEIILTPAVQALGAVAGIVLLVDHTDQQIKIAGSQGYEDGAPTLWQEGPIADHVLIADILRMREALYFEYAGALKEAYPDLEGRTGGLLPAANATLPMFLDDRPLGVIVLDFREPHHFTPAERRFLKILSAQCAVALGRVEASIVLENRVKERTRQLEEERAAQAAFVAFTEAVGSETDLHTQVQRAIAVLQGRFPGASVGYYEEEDRLWKARVWSDDLSLEQVEAMTARFPSEMLLIAEVLQTRQPVFTEAWDAQQQGVDSSRGYGVGAGYPLLVNGELHSLFMVGLRGTRRWSTADQALLRAVGRSLGLALERTETARQIVRQNAELQARTQALEAFADLTRNLALTTDPLLLIRRAQEVMMSMLSEGATMYFVPEGDLWHNRIQHGTLHSPELQAAIDAGLPYAGTNSLLNPWTTGQPYYQDVSDQDTDQLPSTSEHINATAALPLWVEGALTGVLSIALFHQRVWSSVDRVVLETVVQSLELALDRAAKTRRLDEERTALEAFTRFTQAVGSETDVRTLVEHAITLLEEIRSSNVSYSEREDDLFKIKHWNAGFPADLLARSLEGYSLDQPSFGRANRERQAIFEEFWDAQQQGVPSSAMYRAAAFQPFFQDGEMSGMLIMGSRTLSRWSERDKGIFQAVGQSLDLALDRARQTETLKDRNAELDARTQALEGFALLTRNFSLEHDPVNLVGRAQELVLSLLPSGSSTYYELQGAHWHLLFHRGFSQDSTLLQVLQPGVPRGSVLNLDRPLDTRLPHYQEPFDMATTAVAQEEFRAIGATAALPVFVSDQVQGVLVFGLYQEHAWSVPERTVLETVASSLGLALERSQATGTLIRQRDLLHVQTASLTAANEELEAFTYSVSHDLRTPVRHIHSFTELLRKSLQADLNPLAERYLTVVGEAADRMNTLIDAMLDLSRSSRHPLRFTAVDLGVLVGSIQAALNPETLDRQVVWTLGDLPTVLANQGTLRQVLSNLMGNALKYTRPREEARIEVWTEDQGEQWIIRVRDNGVGFDPKYRERLFGLFQRLHPERDFEGIGVGLATTKRIVLRHGGEVFAEGHPGEGATFGFTLPKVGT